MTIAVPAGNHVIEWIYKPSGVCTAIIVSLISLLLILFYFVLKSFRKKSVS